MKTTLLIKSEAFQSNRFRAPNRRSRLQSLLLPIVAVGLFFAPAANAANVLSNPSLEGSAALPAPNWTIYGASWGNYALQTAAATAQDGNNSFKVFGQFTGGDNFSGIYQSVASGPGATFTAQGWVYSPSGDHIVGNNTAWLEVTFRNAADNILALYRSATVDPNTLTDTWMYLSVTNQYDPSNFTVTNTVTSLVAPPGTATARIQVVFFQRSDNAGGALFWDGFVLDQTSGPVPPSISNIAPGGLALFNNAAAGLSFTASSPSTTISNSGIQVVLNDVDVSSQLVISGSATSKNVSYSGLRSNRLYTASIRVEDVNGFASTATVSFDTFVANNFVWEAEDFDFDGGQFINNSVPATNNAANSYYGRAGQEGIDEHAIGTEGDRLYRASDNIATTTAADLTRQEFLNAGGVPDYKVGWHDGGEWMNYTRAYPNGTFNVYARVAGGNGAATVTLSRVTSGQGTASQTTTNLGTFSFVGDGWSSFEWVPLRDSFGNLVPVNFNGQTTLRSTTGGSADLNFFMLVPPRNDLPAITGVYPSGTKPFEPTNTLAFVASSTGAAINNSGIKVTLNGADVSSQLVIGGATTSKNVTLPNLKLNAVYRAVITVTDADGNTASLTVNFDTFSESSFTFEAEDFDFNGGQFLDNPTPTAVPAPGSFIIYPDGNPANAAIFGIDLTTPNSVSGEQFVYRPFESCGTEVSADFLRQKYVTAQQTDPAVRDHNIGWWVGGTWVNYTRVIPTNSYNIFGRLAGGGAYSGTTVSLVTSGRGTSNQVTQLLGSFADPNANGWQSWRWVPLLDAGNQPALVSLGGTNTLRVTSGSGLNANYFMLVPAPESITLTGSRSGANFVVAFPTRSGATYSVLYKTNLSDANWQTLQAVPGDGSTKSVNDPITTQRFYRVSVQ